MSFPTAVRCLGDITVTSSSIEAWLRAGLLSTEDPRIDGHFDVLEDVFLLDNPWGREWRNRTIARGDTVDEGWFSHASFGYQSGWERVPDYYLIKDGHTEFPPRLAESVCGRLEYEKLDVQ